MAYPLDQYIVSVDVVAGSPDARMGSPVPPDSDEERPQLPGGLWGSIQDTLPIRLLLDALDADRRALRAYPRHFLLRYQELVTAHVPAGHNTFGFFAKLPLRADVISSWQHGAGVILTRGKSAVPTVRRIRQPIEEFAWPETTDPLVGNPTTLVVARQETVVFQAGHRLRARGGATIRVEGTIVYEGRMVLKGEAHKGAWSGPTARLDALLSFLREARGKVAAYANLHRDAMAERLLIVGREIAEMERAGSFKEHPNNYIDRSREYFELVRGCGYGDLEGAPLLDAIRGSTETEGVGREVVKEAGKAVLGDAVKAVLIFLAAIALGSLAGNPIVGAILGVCASLIVWAAFRRRRR